VRIAVLGVIVGGLWTSVGVVAFLLVRLLDAGHVDAPIAILVAGAIVYLPVLLAAGVEAFIGRSSTALPELVLLSALCGAALGIVLTSVLAAVRRKPRLRRLPEDESGA